MSNRNLLKNESLPKSRRIYLCLPQVEDKKEFLFASKESIDLHDPDGYQRKHSDTSMGKLL